jgi:tetratricopeptide (TPR) repeat protein
LFAILGIIILILRRVAQATGVASISDFDETRPETHLRDKGVPAAALSKSRKMATIGMKKAWRFILEAKGLSQSPKVNYKINKFLKRTDPEESPAPAALDENYYIDQIKRFPKDWQHYNNLGQFYLDIKNYKDALGVYEYLTKQDSLSGDFWARLGYIKICMSDFAGAAKSYEKSVGLDESHPNRYYNLGLSYVETGEIKKARSALKKAIELEPENSKYAEALAEI